MKPLDQPASGSERTRGYKLIAAIAFLTLGLFTADLQVPLGVAGGVPYIAVILLALWLPNPSHVIRVAWICSALTLAGFILSPVGGELWKVLANRGLALFAIWATTFLSLERLAMLTALKGTQRERDRGRVEARLLQTQKLESLGVLAGGIAHDFNNLLVSIIGNADLALVDLPPMSPARQRLTEIDRAAFRAADLCREMLAYAGKGQFKIELLGLGDEMEEIANLLSVSISKKVVLVRECAADLPLIRADATQIRQIILNLITNASEAIGDGNGTISIRTGTLECDAAYFRTLHVGDELPDGEYVYMEVADTGSGMDVETQTRLFDPFFTTKFTGRGLGLAAVLGIVRSHGGAIKVHSDLGKGTTMTVVFPVAEDAEGEQHLQEPQASVPLIHGEGTVLLVDDEESVRSTVKLLLERLGFEVRTAVDGLEAVGIFESEAPAIDCVLLDLTMPRMDGEETIRELHRLRPDVPIILSSGYTEYEVSHRFAGLGLSGFLEKPYELTSLSGALRKILDPAAIEARCLGT